VTALGTIRLLEALRESGLSKTRLYQTSSSEMFGSSPPPQKEKTSLHPSEPGCKSYRLHTQAAHCDRLDGQLVVEVYEAGQHLILMKALSHL
jgi:GDP-D-mannose dehydratase